MYSVKGSETTSRNTKLSTIRSAGRLRSLLGADNVYSGVSVPHCPMMAAKAPVTADWMDDSPPAKLEESRPMRVP